MFSEQLELEFEWSTKNRIGPSTPFYIHNFGRPRTRSDLPGHSCAVTCRL